MLLLLDIIFIISANKLKLLDWIDTRRTGRRDVNFGSCCVRRLLLLRTSDVISR